MNVTDEKIINAVEFVCEYGASGQGRQADVSELAVWSYLHERGADVDYHDLLPVKRRLDKLSREGKIARHQKFEAAFSKGGVGRWRTYYRPLAHNLPLFAREVR